MASKEKAGGVAPSGSKHARVERPYDKGHSTPKPNGKADASDSGKFPGRNTPAFQQAIRDLADKNAWLIPCEADKSPRKGFGWKTRYLSAADAIDHLQSDDKALIGVRPNSLGMAVVDVDYGGLEAVAALKEKLGEPVCCHETRREGGYHLWFAKEGEQPNGDWKLPEGSGEIRGGSGYVILHDPERVAAAVNGGVSGDTDLSQIYKRRKATPTAKKRTGTKSGQIDVARALLAHINPNIKHDEGWLDVGFGLHDKFDGSEQALELWDEWSKNGGNYEQGLCARKWQTFSTGGGKSFGTIVQIAKEGGANYEAILKEHRDEESRKSKWEEKPAAQFDFQAEKSPEAIQWLTEGWLPYKLTLLAGRQKIGKSTVAMYIAACVTKGIEPFTEKKTKDGPGRVIYYSGEDGYEDTILPRLMMMGADTALIRPLEGARKPHSFDWTAKPETDGNSNSTPSPFEHFISQLEREKDTHPPIRLVVVDPAIDVVAGNPNDAKNVRHGLERAFEPIHELGIATLGIHHTRKGQGGRRNNKSALEDEVLGSQAWTAYPRVVLGVEGLPAQIAYGKGGKGGRVSPCKRYKISERNLSTNAKVVGCITRIAVNIANKEGGWHYELPIAKFSEKALPIQGNTELNESTYAYVRVNKQMIADLTPNQIFETYDEFAGKAPEAATEREAKQRMKEKIDSVSDAMKAGVEILNAADSKTMKTEDFIKAVEEATGIGKTNIRTAMRRISSNRNEGRIYYRVLKKEHRSVSE
ncbi:MAG: AAA family ATPase [Gammaproteobacteria bacterium]|nr:AAA family ATPase [Gammaproteobacteria bacterium]